MEYECEQCGWIYNEEKEGKPFNQLPPDWVCPLCGAPKEEFK